jgi:lysophospholipase L1-like esterase
LKFSLQAVSGLVRRSLRALGGNSGKLVRSRRTFIAAAVLVAAGFSLPYVLGSTKPQLGDNSQRWVGTWGTAQAGPVAQDQAMTFNDQTLRLIVHTSIGGSQVRIRLSNELGSTPLRIGSAHIALRQEGPSIVPGTDRVLTFGGGQGITIAPGAPVLSDPVDMNVPALSDIAVSLHLPGTVEATAFHGLGYQTNYVSRPGNFAGAVTLQAERTITSWPFLTEVDVSAPRGASIVAFGDSITDGASTKAELNHRWPDLLALRMKSESDQSKGKSSVHQAASHGSLGVVNRGISGARLLRDPGWDPLFGKSALARFDRDVLATAGVQYMIVFIGINDIGHPGMGNIPSSEEPTPEEMISGYRQLITRARAKGIASYGVTLTPFEGTVFAGYYTPAKEAVRQAVNNWIRSSGEFDAVIDFERAVRDPSRPTRMLPAYDSGDHLHPNDAGMQAMANAIPLELFRNLEAVQ